MTVDPRPAPDVDRILAGTTAGDFDGHTVFAELTPEQRLDALGRMITVLVELRGLARRPTAGRARSPAP